MMNGGLGVIILLMVFVAFVGRLKENQKTGAKAGKRKSAEERAMGWAPERKQKAPKKKARPVAADIPKVQAAKAPEQQMSTVRPERIKPAAPMPGEKDDPYALSPDELLEPDRLAWGIVMAEILGKPKGME